MKKLVLLAIFFASFSIEAQNSIDELLKSYNTESVPYMTVQELAMPKTDAVILDSREPKEYEVSHISNAINVGYDHFDINAIQNVVKDKSKVIVVYCSVGIRSEDIGEKLKDAGYTNVYNLFGGIFEWKNKGFTVYDSENKETKKVHTFSKAWSKWLKKGKKVYGKKNG
ncbi:rhodanese-like domain-containing protein [Winogradskyella sp. PE311]|uniref:rhodanese-like domain-containing protein n=1 Tax=Winogradskyella sp. PE311 TaxID=3366943 RepID=UPI003980C8E9